MPGDVLVVYLVECIQEGGLPVGLKPAKVSLLFVITLSYSVSCVLSQ